MGGMGSESALDLTPPRCQSLCQDGMSGMGDVCFPRTQMTLVLIEKGLVLEG